MPMFVLHGFYIDLRAWADVQAAFVDPVWPAHMSAIGWASWTELDHNIASGVVVPERTGTPFR